MKNAYIFEKFFLYKHNELLAHTPVQPLHLYTKKKFIDKFFSFLTPATTLTHELRLK